MRAHSLVIGLDGADLSVIDALGPDALPELHRLMRRGAYAAQRSVLPPATLPNWATFLTGVDPGQHGVFDFTVRDGYRVRFAGGTVRQAPTWVARLDAIGKQCACIGFPGTWPAEKLQHGVFISGWDSPVAFAADRSFVWPPALFDSMQQHFGTTRFDDVDEFDAASPGWLDRLPDALCQRIARKTALASWLLEQQRWDLFATYFGESDTAAHYLWAAHDPHSPRRPAKLDAAQGDGLRRVYAALDAAVAELLQAAGGDAVELTIVSDHGSGGSSDKVLYLNRILAEAGLLRFRRRPAASAWLARRKTTLLRHTPLRCRDALFGWRNRELPSRIESQARYGAIDMRHTVAFSDELNYFPGVHLNLRGREPQGCLEPSDRDACIVQVRDLLLRLRDPWSQMPVVAAVHRREELFDGPWVERAPDLLLDLHLDCSGAVAGPGYSYNLMPSAGAPVGTGAFRRLAPEEYGGRKGRSLPGSHRPRGLFLAVGPQVAAVGALGEELSPSRAPTPHIADASATVLARLGVQVPNEFSGRVLWEILAELRGDRAQSLRGAVTAPPPTIGEELHHSAERHRASEQHLERRLRALGYVD